MRLLKTKKTNFFRLLLPAFLLLGSCAIPVAPTGGPKDETHPEVVRSAPKNQSVNFEGDRIVLSFSEYVNLKDINNQLMVSPPLEEQPDFVMRGKNLTVKLKEPLKENTTYNFFFGDAIVDITEGNPLQNYNFTFSTGPVIDSLSMSGKVIDAFTLQPVKGAYLMLYENTADSTPYKTRPYYIARTSQSGEFRLGNLRHNKYLMFALNDINSNYIYDMPTEDIGFSDSLVEPDLPQKKEAHIPDTLNRAAVADTSAVQSPAAADSLLLPATDSLPVMQQVKLSPTKSHLIRLFREVDTTQRLMKGALIREKVIALYYRRPTVNPVIRAISPPLEEAWGMTGFNATRDSLTLWVTNIASDSLTLEISDNNTILDTLELALKPAPVRGRAPKPANKPELRSNLIGNNVRPDRPLIITLSDPVREADFSRITLFQDTVQVNPAISFTDSLQTRLQIAHRWQTTAIYQLTLRDSALITVFGHVADSTLLKFKAMTEEETGSIKLNIKVPGEGDHYIIQLLGDKESILDQRHITTNTSLEFKYLRPGKFRFKAIADLNGNGRWDTGNYLLKKQPEPVFYFSKDLELRANWTMEEDWKIE